MTSAVFKKLNLKDQTDILVFDAPDSFESEIALLDPTNVHRTDGGVKSTEFLSNRSPAIRNEP